MTDADGPGADDGPGTTDGSQADAGEPGAQPPAGSSAGSNAEPQADGGETVHCRSAATGTVRATARAERTLGVARREYRVLARVRWPYGLALLFGAFSLGVVALAGSGAGPTTVGALFVTLGELSVYVVPLVALALGYGTVVGASERGTLELLLSVPLRREFVLAGKFLGRAATLCAGMAVGLGAGGALVAVRYGPAVLPAYLHFLATAVAVGVAFLSVGVCVSAWASDKARALGGVLLAWVWFVLVYDLAAVGAVVVLDPPQWALPLLVVGNPADVLRVVVLSLVPSGGGGVGAVLPTTAVPGPLVVAALAAWVCAPVALGGALLARRSR